MNIISLFIVYMGVILLIAAMFPTKALCDQKHHATLAWRILGVFIILFIIGYSTYGVYLFKTDSSAIELIVSIIIFGGGVFVFSVVKLAHVSINKLSMMADEERYRSLHDDLTGLPNQNFFHNKIEAAIDRENRLNKEFVIILIDIDRFKEINSSLGYFYGDFILQQISARLKNSVRNSDTLARWGGDKFAILLPDTNLKTAIAISNTITESLIPTFQIEGHGISVETSHGIAIFPEHGEQIDRLLQSAHIALYEAQKNHVSYSIFDPDQHRSPFKKLIMASNLRDAINNGNVVMYFQPQISAINGKLSGVEALMRWHHPEKGLISPKHFIDVIEQTDVSKSLTNWALNEALKYHQEWQRLGLDINVSVNLSINNLHDYDFPGEVRNLIDNWQVAPNRLTLEITESGLMVDPERVTKVVSELKSIGINLSIDDFGTGYSSLAYLRKFPAREIKIDKSFILDMFENEDSAIIVKSTIDLAHNIGRLVVAEGVETKETYDLLKKLGSDFLQGFYFSKALPSNEFIEWLSAYNKSLEEQPKI